MIFEQRHRSTERAMHSGDRAAVEALEHSAVFLSRQTHRLGGLAPDSLGHGREFAGPCCALMLGRLDYERPSEEDSCGMVEHV